MTLIAAVGFNRLIANQIFEGSINAELYSSFLYEALLSVRKDPELQKKQVVILMDNARIHVHERVLETAKKFKATILFNAEYSPWINPVE